MPTSSWQVYSDNSTMLCLARNAALHSLFVPYRKGSFMGLTFRKTLLKNTPPPTALMANHSTYGYPLVRSLWMHYPDDPIVRTAQSSDAFQPHSFRSVSPFLCFLAPSLFHLFNQASNITTQVLLGSEFLLAPVLQPSSTTVCCNTELQYSPWPLTPSASSHKVHLYLPAGNWTHLWSGENVSGGQFLDIAVRLRSRHVTRRLYILT